MLQCFRSTRRPSTRSAPSPFAYTGPIRSMTGLERNSGSNPSGASAIGAKRQLVADALQRFGVDPQMVGAPLQRRRADDISLRRDVHPLVHRHDVRMGVGDVGAGEEERDALDLV